MSSKVFSRDKKKIFIASFILAIFLLLKGGFYTEDTAMNIFVFVLMFFGMIIASTAIWTGVASTREAVTPATLLVKNIIKRYL